MATKPTQARLLELFRLDAEQGQLIRKISVSSRAREGDVAGCLHKASGYWIVCVDGVSYRQHLVIWCMLYGQWLPREIDHKDRDRTNNRPLNLRRATESQQRQNAAVRSDNTTGYRGVKLHVCGKYNARIFIDGKETSLGLFGNLEDAAEAARNARLQHYGDFAPSYDINAR